MEMNRLSAKVVGASASWEEDTTDVVEEDISTGKSPQNKSPAESIDILLMSQWGKMNVKLHQSSHNDRIFYVLTKAAEHIVPEGYIMKEFVLEYNDSDASEPTFYTGLEQDSPQSIFELLRSTQIKWMWVMAQPRNNRAEQGISSMYLTNSHLVVLGAQDAQAAYQKKTQNSKWLK